MAIASMMVLSAIFCIWLAGMLPSASALHPSPIAPNHQSAIPGLPQQSVPPQNVLLRREEG